MQERITLTFQIDYFMPLLGRSCASYVKPNLWRANWFTQKISHDRLNSHDEGYTTTVAKLW